MENKKLTSKRVSVILFTLFIIALTFFTIYSRIYVHSQRPLVALTFFETTTLTWTFETRSTIELASEIHNEVGAVWTIEVYVPLSAFDEYMSSLHSVYAEAVADGLGLPESLSLVERRLLDCGGYTYIFNYDSIRIWSDTMVSILPGEGVTVHLTHIGAETYDFVLPVSAVHQDPYSGEYYIFSAHRRRGAWGWEYYARQEFVEFIIPRYIGGMANVFPSRGVSSNTIIYWSQWPLYDGALFRLWD